MVDNAKRLEKGLMGSSVLTLILGLVLLIAPDASLKFITFIIALFAILMGVFQLVEYLRMPRENKIMSLSLILGIIFLAVGIFLMLNLTALVTFITLMMGIFVAVKSVFKIQFAFNLRELSDKWKYNLVVGLVGMTLGVLLIFNPFGSAATFLRIIGLVLAISSIIELIEAGSIMKTLDDAKELPFVEKKKKSKEDKKDKKEV